MAWLMICRVSGGAVVEMHGSSDSGIARQDLVNAGQDLVNVLLAAALNV
jgi:hypothetical protein